MPSDAIEDLLKSDFDDLTAQLENDRFAGRMLFKLGAQRRARLGIIAFAGGIGAAFAASQFSDVVSTITAPLNLAAPELAAGLTSQLFATLTLAGVLVATALVLRQDA